MPATPDRASRRPTPDGVLILPASADRDEWLEARRWREGVGYCIGASDAASILDLPECGTPREVYQDKVGGIQRPETEAMRWGRLHEKTIAWEWEHRRQSVVRNVGLVSNVDYPWLQCTLDRRVAECPDNREELRNRCALEVKTRGAYRNTRWHAEVPDDILAQCMVQMMVTGYRHVHTAVLVGGSELHDPVVWWDQELADFILHKLWIFKENLEAGIEPDWSDAKSDKEIALDFLMHPDRIGEIGIDDTSLVINYGNAAAAAGEARRSREEAVAALLRLADGKQTLMFAGQPAVWWRKGANTRVDLDVLARFPEAYAAAVSTKTTWTICLDPLYRGIEPRE